MLDTKGEKNFYHQQLPLRSWTFITFKPSAPSTSSAQLQIKFKRPHLPRATSTDSLTFSGQEGLGDHWGVDSSVLSEDRKWRTTLHRPLLHLRRLHRPCEDMDIYIIYFGGDQEWVWAWRSESPKVWSCWFSPPNVCTLFSTPFFPTRFLGWSF